ncbi:GGDEF domain-containing protein [Pelagibacterium lacus]|uniref:diguanylate cyclase n=1 Tax=Pelagibacterium lacus TaxID=2282655 RepID=A0A369W3B2_9HYPH|nr:GGDEF domain-containing protein [Pelagibacterium lacus]RDE07762.1 GGDEF domain-containing protein [Pelagibacterium lacus]
MLDLDFLTLYIVIFLNSLTVTVVWAAFAYIYRPHSASVHWLAACALSLVGGIVLAVQGNEGALVPAIAGNTIIIFGFSQFWIGLRRFRNMAGGQGAAVAITAIAFGLMVAMHDNDRGRAMVYAGGQSTVMLVCLIHLLRNRLPGIGAFIAIVAFSVAGLGQIMVIVTNWAVLAGTLDYAVYYALASYALLCTVFSGTVWNLGFAMMTVDSLHQRLARLSETDELTGLANRRALQRALDAAGLRGSGHSVLLIDLNDFKPLNDTHGHAAGDAALQFFGRLISECVRSTDVVARIGGDEFCILLPGATRDDAEEIAREIRTRLQDTPFMWQGRSLALSASIGAAQSREAMGTQEDLVAVADRRLYKDKVLHKTVESQVQPSKMVS